MSKRRGAKKTAVKPSRSELAMMNKMRRELERVIAEQKLQGKPVKRGLS